MGRVEKNAKVQEDVAQMKGEVVKTVKMSGKGSQKGMLLGCLLTIVIPSTFLVILAAWLTAATGLVKVPVISSFAYDKPSPIRVVEPGVPLDTVISNELTKEVTRRIQQGGGTIQNRRITLALPEESFTASMRTVLEESNIAEIDPTNAQAAVNEDIGMELFLPLANNAQESAIRLRVKAVVENGLFDLLVTDVWIGDLHLPRFLSDMLLGPVIDANMEQFNQEIGKYLTIQQIRYGAGAVTLEGEINVEILEFGGV